MASLSALPPDGLATSSIARDSASHSAPTSIPPRDGGFEPLPAGGAAQGIADRREQLPGGLAQLDGSTAALRRPPRPACCLLDVPCQLLELIRGDRPSEVERGDLLEQVCASSKITVS
jgi:hypothetical protein